MVATTTLGFGNLTIYDIIATTTANVYSYLSGVLPTLMVFSVIIGILFMSIRWVWGLIRGHGHRP